MNITENPIYRYFNYFLNKKLIENIRNQEPIDFTKEPTIENLNLFFSLPRFQLFEFFFSERIIKSKTIHSMINANIIQDSANELIPKTLEKYWQIVRRKEGFTNSSFSTSSYDPSLIIEINDLFKTNNFKGLDEYLSNNILKEIQEIENISLESKVNYELIELKKLKETGLEVYTFNTPFGKTTSSWNLNSNIAPYLIFEKKSLN